MVKQEGSDSTRPNYKGASLCTKYDVFTSYYENWPITVIINIIMQEKVFYFNFINFECKDKIQLVCHIKQKSASTNFQHIKATLKSKSARSRRVLLYYFFYEFAFALSVAERLQQLCVIASNLINYMRTSVYIRLNWKSNGFCCACAMEHNVFFFFLLFCFTRILYMRSISIWSYSKQLSLRTS